MQVSVTWEKLAARMLGPNITYFSSEKFITSKWTMQVNDEKPDTAK